MMNFRFLYILTVLCLIARGLPAADLLAEESVEDELLADMATEEGLIHDWQSKISLGMQLTRGGSDTESIHFGIDISKETPLHFFILRAKSGYGKTKDSTSEDSSYALLKYKRLLSDNWFVSPAFTFYRNPLSAVTYRINPSLSVGKFILKNDTYRLYLEAGPSYVFERIDKRDNNYFAPRIGQRFEWAISETFKVYEEVDLIAELSDFSNHILYFETGIESSITSRLSFNVGLHMAYDSQPAPNRDDRDIKIINSLDLSL